MSTHPQQVPSPDADAPREEVELGSHPGPRQYVAVAVVLAIVTAIEVALFYIPAVESFLVPTLIVLSLIKFALVVLWFMHLKFDSRIFMRLFVAGLVITLSVFFIVLATFVFRGGPAPTIGG